MVQGEQFWRKPSSPSWLQTLTERNRGAEAKARARARHRRVQPRAASRVLVCFLPPPSPPPPSSLSSFLPTRSTLTMDYGRRSTMQPHADPYANARSNLPVPSTVKKSTHGHGRMSLAGPAMRAPYPIPPGTNPRQSLMRSQNVNPLLQSASKPQNFGRTPMRR